MAKALTVEARRDRERRQAILAARRVVRTMRASLRAQEARTAMLEAGLEARLIEQIVARLDY
jgi:hypothetical protein